MNVVNKATSIAVEVTLALFFVLIVLAPFHSQATHHLSVTQTIDPTLAEISGDVSGLAKGEAVSLYRFNYGWKAPIGTARIEEIDDSSARIRIDPRDMQWPIGRHSIVTHTADGKDMVALGASDGFVEGDYLSLFQNRVRVGEAQIVQLGETQSEIRVPRGVDGTGNTLVASEFSTATQVAIYEDHFLSAVEIAAILFVLLAYIATYLHAKRSPFLVLGESLRRIPISRDALFWIVHIAVAPPFVWFVTKMPLYLGAYLYSYLSSHFFAHPLYPYPAIDTMLPYAYAAVGVAYAGYLVLYRSSPILRLWGLISYRGSSGVRKVSFARGLLLWALHLVIVYAFASTLLGFLRGDIAAAMAIGFPAPTVEAWFEQAKFLIWTLTVIGVLIGYGYSVLSILWGKYIRNLDFTVTGWLTNGFCYPLFGVVIWQMTPAFTGIDPIITGGPLLYLMLVLGLVLNLLYMLSIFNLGILFDLMTDKGVRTSGFYSVMRHPNYMLEACMFFVTELVGLAAGVQWLGLSMYLFLYWIRSEREDNFMQWSNPEYAAYQKATPWKFIPGIY